MRLSAVKSAIRSLGVESEYIFNLIQALILYNNIYTPSVLD
jgi:hypothetical protein